MRSWPGLAAIGAGLIHLGVAAGCPPLLLVPLALVGAVEAAWGVAALARTAPPGPKPAFAAAVLLVAAWVAVLLTGGGGHQHGAAAAGATASPAGELPIGALGGAGLLDLAAAVLLAVVLRRGGEEPSGFPGPVRFLVGAAVAAAGVALVVATSLAGAPVGGGAH